MMHHPHARGRAYSYLLISLVLVNSDIVFIMVVGVGLYFGSEQTQFDPSQTQFESVQAQFHSEQNQLYFCHDKIDREQ